MEIMEISNERTSIRTHEHKMWLGKSNIGKKMRPMLSLFSHLWNENTKK